MGTAKSAFKKNIKVVETGPEFLTSEQAKQQVGEKRKTVSLTEERVTSTGETVKTITTTVTQMKTQKSQSVSSVILDKSSSETETSESEDETSSDSSESQEEYETEQGKIQRQRSESLDLLTSASSSKPVFSRSISGKKARPPLIQSQISKEDKSKSLPNQQRPTSLSSEPSIKPKANNKPITKDEKERKRKEMLDRHEQMRKDAEESHRKQQEKSSLSSSLKPVISQKPSSSTQSLEQQQRKDQNKKVQESEIEPMGVKKVDKLAPPGTVDKGETKDRSGSIEEKSPPPPPPPATTEN